ncbi:polyisoprenoid-binding protein YceI [Catalinimonas alkaloidigena]|uniref:YceI family protein n=1 Tax=Catalinimonas alkaloidigena TaxID=1075417 RepID=UPI00240606D8|nr:YceI family protein [Catalinimonas alkaloidigena]MDF9798208.1 polyisoprenoid-binding protein YceI [Catalinimonas alkaloidigena]
MKSLKLIASVALIASVLVSFTLPTKVESYNVDAEQSTLIWTGRKVTGEHTGTINIKEGNLEVNGEKLEGGSFTIDMSTIENADLEGEYKGKLEGHLKSDDFFGVASHPTAQFVITQARAQENGQYEITGDLTIKNITNEVTFPAEVKVSGNQVTADAKIVVDRSKYNVRYGSGSFFDNLGDKTIYDEFDLEVSLVANTAVGK